MLTAMDGLVIIEDSDHDLNECSAAPIARWASRCIPHPKRKENMKYVVGLTLCRRQQTGRVV